MMFLRFVVFSLLSTMAFAFPQIKKSFNGVVQPLYSQPQKQQSLAVAYPEYLEILRVLDPVGTASLPKMKFLTDEWKMIHNNEIIGSDLFGYGLIYEFAKEVEDNATVMNDHEVYCANCSKHLLRTFDVPLVSFGGGNEQELLSGQGKVLLFASLDKLALRTEILRFLSNDPLVVNGYLSNWMLLERNEIISYIKVSHHLTHPLTYPSLKQPLAHILLHSLLPSSLMPSNEHTKLFPATKPILTLIPCLVI